MPFLSARLSPTQSPPAAYTVSSVWSNSSTTSLSFF